MPLRKTRFLWLLDKEWRELVAARAWWVLLLAMGPLVGVSFIAAARAYAEASAGGAGEVLSPLTGVWAPAFSACELAALFLLPFAAIRVVSGDRQSGALKLELQQKMSPASRITAKALVLLAGWLLAMLAPLFAVLLWMSHGGSVYWPEVGSLVCGHVLNAGLTIALAAAMASLAEHPSTAAILTLSITTGTWIIEFFAAIKGGWWERAAAYTPTSMVADFQHGLVRLDVVLIALVLTAGGLGVAAVWMRLGVLVRQRVYETAALCAAAVVLIWALSGVRANWDLSENRANSFSRADERALQAIRKPLRIEAHLAQEDPRRTDLERHALEKMRRLLPDLRVEYVAATGTGLFEQNTEHYGEIWYEMDGRKLMNRMTGEEDVLGSVYELAGVTVKGDPNEPVFRGHPLATPLSGAELLFYGLWPVLVVSGGAAVRRNLR